MIDWTCPNCGTANEFSVQHCAPDDIGAIYPVIECHVCGLFCSDERAEKIRAIWPRINRPLTSGTEIKVLPVAWSCAAQKANHGPNDPPECDWPGCGCDPHFDRVVVGLRECGWTVEPPKFIALEGRRDSGPAPDAEVKYGPEIAP